MEKISSNKILVTGCCGFIGSHLSIRLCELGFEVVGIDWMKYFRKRKLESLSLLRKLPSFTFIEGDVRDSLPEESFFCTFHIAALPGVRSSIENPMETVGCNVGGTTSVFDWASRGFCQNVIYASSSSVYGLSRDTPFSEDQIINSPNSPYAASKVSTETIASTYCRLFPIRAIGMRFFTVYGPRGREDMAIHKFLTAVSEGKPLTMFGDGTSSRDYTFVGDIVSGILNSMNFIAESMPLHSHEIFNLGNSKPVLLTHLIKLIEETVGKEAIINNAPDQLGDVTITFAEISKARRLIDFNPKTDLSKGLEVTWQSMKIN